MIGFLWRRVSAVIETLVLLGLVIAAVAGWRLYNQAQFDDGQRIGNKREYLEQVKASARPTREWPNIIFLLYDDLGYGDLGAGSDNTIKTPNFDLLAADGLVLTDFHSPAPVCTPSRAGYLTGRLAPRAGLPHVVFPTDSTKARFSTVIAGPEAPTRLPAEEITLADLLGAAGYATGMVGKWHLGDRSPSLPNDMGFTQYFGALYSNDMEPFAFYRDRRIVAEAPVDQTLMTERYTREAIDFIEAHAEERFFLYFAHNFPHDPLHIRESRAGTSDAGLFGDVIEEIDEGVGRILATLQERDLLDNTLIIVSSDNGPWYLGDAGDQRGRKGRTFEGGMRVPFIAHWPDGIAGGRTESAMAMGIDLFPTLLELLELPAPHDRSLDGQSLLTVLTQGGPSPHEFLYYIDGEQLFAVRDQRFKYRAPATEFYGTDQMPFAAGVPQKEWLFDLREDPRESYDTSLRHPDVLQRLRAAYEAKRREMALNPRGWH